jgi:hypothetical protein
LRLDANRITALPEDINHLQKLTEYTVTGNPIAAQ